MFNPNTDEFTRDCKTMIMKELIEKYGVSKNTIQRKKKELGISKWYLAAGRLDINTDDVIADYESGMTINELKNKYHLSNHNTTSNAHQSQYPYIQQSVLTLFDFLNQQLLNLQ